MKTLIFILFSGLLLPALAYSKDGYCKCIFHAKKEEVEEVTANSRRPVICESCESRCSLLIDRVKEKHHTDEVKLVEFDCS